MSSLLVARFFFSELKRKKKKPFRQNFCFLLTFSFPTREKTLRKNMDGDDDDDDASSPREEDAKEKVEDTEERKKRSKNGDTRRCIPRKREPVDGRRNYSLTRKSLRRTL